MMAADRLIVFTRFPLPGATKTRLIPLLGGQGAADLHKAMTERTVATVRRFRRQRNVLVEVRFTGERAEPMREWLGSDLAYAPQGRGFLGSRMGRAFQAAFEAGCRRVVLIGTDCPGLSVLLLRRAFRDLLCHDAVLGPAADGGYYLIGLQRFVPQIFRKISWGTKFVMKETRGILVSLGLRVSLLDTLADVDRPEDIIVWNRAISGLSPRPFRK